MAETERQVSTCGDCRFFGSVVCRFAETTRTPDQQTAKVNVLEAAPRPERGRSLEGADVAVNYNTANPPLEQDMGNNAVDYVADKFEACATEQRGPWTSLGRVGLGMGSMQRVHCSALEKKQWREQRVVREPGIVSVHEMSQSAAVPNPAAEAQL